LNSPTHDPATSPEPDDTVAISPFSRSSSPSLIAKRYEIRDFLGRGGCGEVFEAYDRVLGRLVAIKVIPVGDDGTREIEERLRAFQMEARGVSRLSHPAIITVHDFGQGQGVAWIVMELVIGETLREALSKTGRLSVQEAVRISTALLGALHYAHGRGIVHRDVKPGNVLLEYSLTEDIGAVRLSDFGIARMGGEEKTIVGQILGTPWFMAPEQLRGEVIDHRIDIWAMGVVLHEMLTGERPFNGPVPAIFHRIQTEEPPAPSSLRSDLPSGFDAVVAKALAKNPAARFATAQEMTEAILAAHALHPHQQETDESADTTSRRWPEEWPLLTQPAAQPSPAALVAPPPAATRRNWHGFALGFVAGAIAALAGIHLGKVAGRTDAMLAMDVAAAQVVTLEPAPAAAEEQPPTIARAAPEPPTSTVAIVPQTDGRTATKPAPPLPKEPAVADATGTSEVASEAQARSPEATPLPTLVEASPPQLIAVPDALHQPDPVATASSPASPSLPIEPPHEAVPESPPSIPANAALPVCTPDIVRSRSGNHPGYGRIVFEWQRPMTYRVRPTDGGVEIEFLDAPCMPDLAGLRLPRNAASLRIDAAHQALLLQTVRGNQVLQQRWQGRLILDIQD